MECSLHVETPVGPKKEACSRPSQRPAGTTPRRVAPMRHDRWRESASEVGSAAPPLPRGHVGRPASSSAAQAGLGQIPGASNSRAVRWPQRRQHAQWCTFYLRLTRCLFLHPRIMRGYLQRGAVNAPPGRLRSCRSTSTSLCLRYVVAGACSRG